MSRVPEQSSILESVFPSSIPELTPRTVRLLCLACSRSKPPTHCPVHCSLGWTQQFSSRELFLVRKKTGCGCVSKQSIKILRIAFNGHRSIESLTKTFQVIILRTFAMDAAIAEPDVCRKIFLELLKTVHVMHANLHLHLTVRIPEELRCAHTHTS